jgi:hypothetical protein
MQHSSTYHDIARLRHAEAVRRADGSRSLPGIEQRPPLARTSLRWGLAGRLARAARARATALPGSPAA